MAMTKHMRICEGLYKRPLPKWLKGWAAAHTRDGSAALPCAETGSLIWFGVWALPMTSWVSKQVS